MATTPSTLLAYALTGEEVPVRDTDGTAADFLSALRQAGWPPDRVRSCARDSWERGIAWPHPLPPHSLDGLGPARWYAELTAVRTALGLDAIAQPPSRRTVLTQDERRLMAELPPHHGRVG